MTKVLILYYSAYGHMERMAQAISEGVRDAGVEADIKRVRNWSREEVSKQSGFKFDQKAPIATVSELPDYDAIIFGSGTRYFDARHDAGNKLARLAHLDNGDQRAVRIEGGEGSAQVVQLLHGALHRFRSGPMDALSSPPPHSISVGGDLTQEWQLASLHGHFRPINDVCAMSAFHPIATKLLHYGK